MHSSLSISSGASKSKALYSKNRENHSDKEKIKTADIALIFIKPERYPKEQIKAALNSAITKGVPISEDTMIAITNYVLENGAFLTDELVAATLTKFNNDYAACGDVLSNTAKQYLQTALDNDHDFSEEFVFGACRYAITHRLTCPATLVATAVATASEYYEDEPFVDEAAFIRDVSDYVTDVSNNPSAVPLEILESVMTYVGDTETDIPKVAALSLTNFIFRNQLDFSARCKAHAISYMLKHPVDFSLSSIVNGINYMLANDEAEESDLFFSLSSLHRAKEFVFNHPLHFESKVLASAADYMWIHQKQRCLDIIKQAKSVLDQNYPFFKTAIKEQATFRKVYSGKIQIIKNYDHFLQQMMAAASKSNSKISIGYFLDGSNRLIRQFFSAYGDEDQPFFQQFVQEGENYDRQDISLKSVWLEGYFEAVFHANIYVAKYVLENQDHGALTIWREKFVPDNDCTRLI